MTALGEGRRVMHWDRIKGPREFVAIALGTAGGAGLAPFAPGSMGTLVGVALHYGTWNWDWRLRVGFWLAIFFAGVWASRVIDRTMGSRDNQNIVIDEVLGYGITAWTVGISPVGMLVAFVMFRIFDIVKPPPIRQVDRWSHRQESGSGFWDGFGVMADDAAAGFLALASTVFIMWALRAAGVSV